MAWASYVIPAVIGLLGSSMDRSSRKSGRGRTETVPKLTPQQMELLNQFLIPQVRDQRSFTSPEELTSLAALEEQALQTRQSVQQSRGTLSDLQTTATSAFEDFYRTNVSDPLHEEFSRDVIPAINRLYTGDIYGSERREAASRATEDLLKTLVRGKAETRLGAREQALRAATGAPGSEGQLNELLSTIFTARGQPRREQLAAVLAALGVEPYDTAVFQPQQGSNILGSLLGGIGAGFGSAFASS